MREKGPLSGRATIQGVHVFEGEGVKMREEKSR